MTKIVAKFSNGFEDEYKGSRRVKAAWMIVDKQTGKVYASGHSLDEAKARATAENTASGGSWWNVPRSSLYCHPTYTSWLREALTKKGLIASGEKVSVEEMLRRAKADNARRRAERRAQYQIEVVAL